MASANNLSLSSFSFPPSPNSSTSVLQHRFSVLARVHNWLWRWIGGRTDPSRLELVSRWGLTADEAASSSREVEPTKEFVRYLACLYIYNASKEDLRDFNRIIFLSEEAHRHYQDHFVKKYSCLKEHEDRDFTKLMFESCDHLQPYIAEFDEIYLNFTQYRKHITVCGAVILNATYDKCLLVHRTNWGFPKGKRSKNEEDHQCATREVFEKVGFDISKIWSEKNVIENVYNRQRERLFIIPSVNEDTKFATVTKNEINAISWHRVDEVDKLLSEKERVFLLFLKRWIAKNPPPNATHISSRDLMAKKQHIAIFTAACPPLMTGTAVNSLFRAAYLAKDGNRKVCLVIPWLYLEDQKLAYPDKITFNSPSEHEAYVREWLQKMTPFTSDIFICFYRGKFSRERSSILPVGDITLNIPDNEADIAVLEEPDQLTSYRQGLTWKSKFQRVIGVVHTNYLEYVKSDTSGYIQALILKYFNGWVINLFCHKVVRVSGATQQLPRSIICNVHGVNAKFLDIGQVKQNHQRGDSTFSKRSYYLGKIKGSEELIQLLSEHQNQLAGLQMDLYATGEDIQMYRLRKSAEDLKLDVKVYTAPDHADPLFNDYKVFINPSTTDVVCTTTAEALAMGKIVVCANHSSNAFFKKFPNCHMYNNGMEFVNLTLKAQDEEPVPLTDELRHELSWEAATERFVIAAELH